MTALPVRCGIGLRPVHYRAALDCDADGLWFEVHPENYMVSGGPRHSWLEAIRSRRAISFHGVGTSLCGPEPLEATHLARLRELIDRYQPTQVSEHVAWSAAGGQYFADLFPLPYTCEAARHLINRVDAFQSAIGRRILIENPSAYMALRGDMSEPEFLGLVCAGAGCGLLLDVNNVFVAANNLHLDAGAYLDAAPAELVEEIHLAGHDRDAAPGSLLLIDSHATPVAAPVWDLFDRLVRRIGPRPTLIERDAAIPPFGEMMTERARAEDVLVSRAKAA